MVGDKHISKRNWAEQCRFDDEEFKIAMDPTESDRCSTFSFYFKICIFFNILIICFLCVVHVGHPVTPGRSYVGRATWESCVQHDPHNVIVTIAANKKADFFGARTWVRAVVTLEVDEHSHLVQTYIGRGYWSPGKRLIALAPDEGVKAAYAIACKFNLGDDDHADCKIVERASLHVCARFRAASI